MASRISVFPLPFMSPQARGVVVMVITVPVNSVIFGVLASSNVTWKHPPDTVLSRLSILSLEGFAPPLLKTPAH